MASNYPCPNCGMQIPFQLFQAGTQCFCPGCSQPSKAPDASTNDGGLSASPVGAGVGTDSHAVVQAGEVIGGDPSFGGSATPIPQQQSGGFGGGQTLDILPETDSLASLGSRLGASLVDGACVAGIYLMFFLMAGSSGLSGIDESAMGASLFFLVAAIIVLCIIQIYLLTTCGQTIGKKVVGIRIVSYPDGEASGFLKNVLMRGFVNGLISAIPLVGSIYAFVDILFIFGQERRCLHDMIASTKVVNA